MFLNQRKVPLNGRQRVSKTRVVVSSPRGSIPPPSSDADRSTSITWFNSRSVIDGPEKTSRSNYVRFDWRCRLTEGQRVLTSQTAGSTPPSVTISASSSLAKDTRLSSGQLGFKSRCGGHAPAKWNGARATNASGGGSNPLWGTTPVDLRSSGPHKPTRVGLIPPAGTSSWPSLARRLSGGQEIAGSNPAELTERCQNGNGPGC